MKEMINSSELYNMNYQKNQINSDMYYKVEKKIFNMDKEKDIPMNYVNYLIFFLYFLFILEMMNIQTISLFYNYFFEIQKEDEIEGEEKNKI